MKVNCCKSSSTRAWRSVLSLVLIMLGASQFSQTAYANPTSRYYRMLYKEAIPLKLDITQVMILHDTAQKEAPLSLSKSDFLNKSTLKKHRLWTYLRYGRHQTSIG